MPRPLVMIAAALLAALAPLAGCTYNVRVRNETEHPIRARLLQVDALMKDWILADAKVGPGEAVVLGPARTMAGFIVLETITTDANGLAPARRNVLSGSHAFRIGVEDDEHGPRLLLQSAKWSELGP